MLIEFSLTNFRSIKDRQTLSLAAYNRDKNLPQNIIQKDLPGLSNTQYLKSAVIYGANASGKSNFYKAAEFFYHLIVNSATALKPDDETGVSPFRLDEKSMNEPSEFEITFESEWIRYQYGAKLNNEQILEEWLIAYPYGQPQNWFHREFNPEKVEYEWSFSTKYFKGERDSLIAKTKTNTLFLSVGAQFNHEQLGEVYKWFRKYFKLIDFSEEVFDTGFTTYLLHNKPDLKENIISLLSQADLGINDIQIEELKPDGIFFPDEIPNDLKDKILKDMKEKVNKGSVFLGLLLGHKNRNSKNPIYFDELDESMGTRKFFSLLGQILFSFSNNQVLFIDEIGTKMHPLLMRNIIKMIHDPDLNKNGAQVVFTTHDTTLLDNELFRRDQIWFTEKNNEGATTLYPLTDYKPRKDEALQKGYLAGRYGAIPFLSEFKF